MSSQKRKSADGIPELSIIKPKRTRLSSCAKPSTGKIHGNATTSPCSPSLVSESPSQTFSSSSSDSESRLSDDSGEEIITIGRPKKPSMTSQAFLPEASDLRSRLATFLPQLKAANHGLVDRSAELNLENVDEDQEGYIEMDLGLGVLEEKRNGETSDESSDEEEEEDDDDVEGEEEECHEEKVDEGEGRDTRAKAKAKTGVMDRLLGMRGGRRSVGIQVVDNCDEGDG